VAEAFTDETLVGLTLSCIDAHPDSLRFRPVHTGKHNSSYWVESELGRFVLRIAPPDDAGFLFYERLMMRQEPDLHALIRAETSLPVAEIIGYDFSRTRVPRDYLLMRALPGTPVSEVYGVASLGSGLAAPSSEAGMARSQFHRALYQVGQYLRELHTLTAVETLGTATFGYLGPHHPMEPQPTWAEAFHVMWNRLLDDVVACGGYALDEAQVMRNLLDGYIGVFDRPVSSSLLHMDVWSQNILVDGEGNVTGLVDFDRALWGDVEIEFAVLDYCGVSEPPFWAGYGVPRDTSPAAQIRRRFYLLYEVQKYIPICMWRRDDPVGAARYKQQSFALAAELM